MSPHLCLDIATEDPADHAVAQAWNCTGVDEQSFLFNASPFFPGEETISALGSRGSGRCLTLETAQGSEVFQEPCTGRTAQLWRTVVVDSQHVQIQSVATNGCLQESTPTLHAIAHSVNCSSPSGSSFPAQLWTVGPLQG